MSSPNAHNRSRGNHRFLSVWSIRPKEVHFMIPRSISLAHLCVLFTTRVICFVLRKLRRNLLLRAIRRDPFLCRMGSQLHVTRDRPTNWSILKCVIKAFMNGSGSMNVDAKHHSHLAPSLFFFHISPSCVCRCVGAQKFCKSFRRT